MKNGKWQCRPLSSAKPQCFSFGLEVRQVFDKLYLIFLVFEFQLPSWFTRQKKIQLQNTNAFSVNKQQTNVLWLQNRRIWENNVPETIKEQNWKIGGIGPKPPTTTPLFFFQTTTRFFFVDFGVPITWNRTCMYPGGRPLLPVRIFQK